MVLEKVTTFISEQFNVDEDSITEDTTSRSWAPTSLTLPSLSWQSRASLKSSSAGRGKLYNKGG